MNWRMRWRNVIAGRGLQNVIHEQKKDRRGEIKKEEWRSMEMNTQVSDQITNSISPKRGFEL